MHEEEARRVDFGIAWQPDAHECSAVLAIATPLRTTPKILAKLAPATWGEATSLAVRPAGPGPEDIVAWALLERSASTRQPLTIRALDVGVLRVDYAGIPRALYARGETVWLGGGDEFKSPAWWVTQTFADWKAHADPKFGITRIIPPWPWVSTWRTMPVNTAARRSMPNLGSACAFQSANVWVSHHAGDLSSSPPPSHTVSPRA